MPPPRLWPTTTMRGCELPSLACAQAASRQASSCEKTVLPGLQASGCCNDLRKAQLTLPMPADSTRKVCPWQLLSRGRRCTHHGAVTTPSALPSETWFMEWDGFSKHAWHGGLTAAAAAAAWLRGST